MKNYYTIKNIAELFLLIIGSADQWKPNVIREVEKASFLNPCYRIV
jgi:hypothetical protein